MRPARRGNEILLFISRGDLSAVTPGLAEGDVRGTDAKLFHPEQNRTNTHTHTHIKNTDTHTHTHTQRDH